MYWLLVSFMSVKRKLMVVGAAAAAAAAAAVAEWRSAYSAVLQLWASRTLFTYTARDASVACISSFSVCDLLDRCSLRTPTPVVYR